VSRYLLIRRLRGPAFLLLVGVNALMAQAHILRWSQTWPLYLILAGVLLLAERAALSADGYPMYPGAPYAGASATTPAATQQTPYAAPSTETAIVPKRNEGLESRGFENDVDGGRP
jgi:hypothetical protein